MLLYSSAMIFIVKPTKRTTFSINQTTWSESNRLRSDSEADSDTVSEASEASADVRLLLEERRKVSSFPALAKIFPQCELVNWNFYKLEFILLYMISII